MVAPRLRSTARPLAALAAAAALALTGACAGQAPERTAAQVAAVQPKALPDLYADPGSNPAVWARDHAGDPRAARIKESIADRPIARWFGNWSGDIHGAVSDYVGAAQAAGRTPVLVAYNVPGRDCGSHSGGGAGSPEAYRAWISQFAAAVGDRGAIVVIEPDAVAQLDCLPGDAERQTRLDLMKHAIQRFKASAPNARTYLDGGNATWIPADTMAQRLQSAGIADARGFSVNVSNYHTTADSVAYAENVNTALSSRFGYTRTYVVDTSRNGNGSNGEWCNPAGRRLGTAPRAGTDAEYELWIKVPGDSDGDCGIGAGVPAGQFSPDIAVRLIDGT
ncbi:glycoside hydrolase family 6 protein [Spirillospora sp. NPDC047279]|uniref:glycoside hydrolase family 6 protein n=1 Tax=Spirillospora sp. NPDC047279 TaxID=3155478 RepID=UPI0033E12C4F